MRYRPLFLVCVLAVLCFIPRFWDVPEVLGANTVISTVATSTFPGPLGIGTSTPKALFALHATTAFQNPFIVLIASSTPTATTTLFSISNTGTISFGGALPETTVGTIYSATTTKVVTNTTADTTAVPGGVGTTTLPANFFTPGRTVRIRGAGVYELPITGGTATVKVKYGNTTLASVSTTGLLSNTPKQRFSFEATVQAKTVGSAGTVRVDGQAQYASNAATNVSVTDPLNNTGDAVTIDTTVAASLDVTVAWDTAATTKIASTTVATYEVLN